MSPRNSKYGLGTSTVSAVTVDARDSAETVAKQIPVIEDQQEREHRHRSERVVHACAERPCAGAPDAEREPGCEQCQRDGEQRQRQREVQRGWDLVDQSFEA